MGAFDDAREVRDDDDNDARARAGSSGVRRATRHGPRERIRCGQFGLDAERRGGSAWQGGVCIALRRVNDLRRKGTTEGNDGVDVGVFWLPWAEGYGCDKRARFAKRDAE